MSSTDAAAASRKRKRSHTAPADVPSVPMDTTGVMPMEMDCDTPEPPNTLRHVASAPTCKQDAKSSSGHDHVDDNGDTNSDANSDADGDTPLKLKPANINKYGLLVYPDRAPDPDKDVIEFQITDIHVTDDELLGLSTKSHQPGDQDTVYTLENITGDRAYRNFAIFQNRINAAKADKEEKRQASIAEWKRKKDMATSSFEGYRVDSAQSRTFAGGDGDDASVQVPCSTRDNGSGNASSDKFDFCASAREQDSYGGLINRQCQAIVMGVDAKGMTVTTMVPFRPDAFVQVPDHWRDHELEGFNKWVRNKFKITDDEFSTEYVEWRQYYGWVPQFSRNAKTGKREVVGTKNFRYIHIRLPLIKYVRSLKWAFKYGIWIHGEKVQDIQAWETDVDPITKFCDRTGVKPHGWCRVMKNGYEYPDTWYTHSTLEVILKDLDALTGLPDRTDIAPLLCSSSDGEMYCHATKLAHDQAYKFPRAQHPEDPLITWSTSFTRIGTKQLTRVIYCLKETDCQNPDYSHTSSRAEKLVADAEAAAEAAAEAEAAKAAAEAAVRVGSKRKRSLEQDANVSAASDVETSGKRLKSEDGKATAAASAASAASASSAAPAASSAPAASTVNVENKKKEEVAEPDDDEFEDESLLTDVEKARRMLASEKKMYSGWTVQTHIHWFANEQDLLDETRDLYIYADSQIATGYHWFNFDFVYNNARKMAEVEDPTHHRFFYQSKLIGYYTPLEKHTFESSAANVVVTNEINMIGRTTLDMYEWLKRNKNLKNYKLDKTSKKFLGLRKIDLPYQILFDKYEEGPEGRRIIAEYAGRDSDLPLLMMIKLNIHINVIMDSRVYHTNSNEVLKGGQQIRIVNQYIIACHAHQVVMNSDYRLNVKDGYKGANVFDAQRGYYNVPIVVLDFASLYPSVMRFFLFCPSTLVMEDHYKDLPGVVYHRSKTDIGEFWYVQSIQGVPIYCVTNELLSTLLQTRKDKKAVKKKAEKEGRMFDADVAEAEQLAVKGSTNSVYGFHGVQEGKCPCTPVAASTTCEGRRLIVQVLTDIKDSRPGTLIIYGDTDSVFILYPNMDDSPESLVKAFQFGAEDAKHCSRNYKGIVNLEQDKVMFPFLCDKKKRYMGIVRKENGTSEFVAKGVEMVRRDRPPFVTEAQAAVSRTLLYKRDPQGALRQVQENLKNLREGKVPIHKFVISQTLKRESDYANPDGQCHVIVNRKILKRKGEEAAYKVGDRVETIVLYERDPKKQRVADRVEDPAYAREHNLKPDYLHYLKQFQTAMCPLMEPFYEDPSQIYKETEVTISNGNKGLRMLDSMFATKVDPSAAFNAKIKRNQNHLTEEERAALANKVAKRTDQSADQSAKTGKIVSDALITEHASAAASASTSTVTCAAGQLTKKPVMQRLLGGGAMTTQELTEQSRQIKQTAKRKRDNLKNLSTVVKKPKLGNLSSFFGKV
jgi:DNA polymerase elongation subunit (family B)